MPLSTYQMFEYGQRVMSTVTLLDFCARLGINAGQLLNEITEDIAA